MGLFFIFSAPRILNPHFEMCWNVRFKHKVDLASHRCVILPQDVTFWFKMPLTCSCLGGFLPFFLFQAPWIETAAAEKVKHQTQIGCQRDHRVHGASAKIEWAKPFLGHSFLLCYFCLGFLFLVQKMFWCFTKHNKNKSNG